MKVSDIDKEMVLIAERLQLGSLIQKTKAVHGGALHTMWRLYTKAGSFVVKKINPAVKEKYGFSENYEASEKLASFFQKKGVPAVSAIQEPTKNYLINIQENAYLVYPFIEGTLLELNKVTEEHTSTIGALFAKIHQCPSPSFKVPPVEYVIFDSSHWNNLIRHSGYDSLKKILSDILRWNELYQKAIPLLNDNLIITHRDLHRKNVLWSKEGSPHVVDWESAGLMNPQMEVIGYGIEWSGILWSKFDKTHFEALLNAYLGNSNSQDCFRKEVEPAFYGWLGHCVLGWTEFNIRRALGMTPGGEDESITGKDIIENRMIGALNYIQENEASLIDMIKSI